MKIKWHKVFLNVIILMLLTAMGVGSYQLVGVGAIKISMFLWGLMFCLVFCRLLVKDKED